MRCARILAALFFVLAASFAHEARAAEPSHGISTFGALKYPKDFTHFAYANPKAPKGGALMHMGISDTTTFNSLNPFILKGDYPEGLALLGDDTGGSLVFDSLMVRAGDEPDAVYGLIAESAEVAPDRTYAVFYLRPEARWHDGTPITAADVVFTLETFKKKAHPLIRITLRDVASARAPDARTVEIRFKGDNRRDLPLIVATLPIVSKAYYKTHDFEETTLEPPLGSGPYKVGPFKSGTYIVYERVPDYWAKDLPVNRGRWNFDRVRYEYYRDRAAGFEAFASGVYDLREEFTSKTWATEYDFPAVRDGRVKLLTLPDNTPSGVQGYFLNTRRPTLKDPRIRHALDLAFDFEWLNKHVFYSLYKRTASYFQNSDMEASGKPSAAELALLEPFRDRLPPEVFEAPYVPPVTDGSGNNRANLRAARALLSAAGCKVVNGKLLDANGKPLAVEFVESDPRFIDVLAPYLQTLKSLGIDATARLVDPAQYERRRKAFDFDVTTARFSQSLTPGVELRTYFGSEAASAQGTNNLAGITDPVVDALIERVIAARSREELVTATRALDRVLRAGHYWVSHWYKASHHLAFWDKFGRPALQPRFQRGILDTWWLDQSKAARLTNRKGR
jgi:microcin C transport system substrate-binding protein